MRPINTRIYAAIINYLSDEFEYDEGDILEELHDMKAGKNIGLAYTTLDEEQDDGSVLCEMHETQVDLSITNRAIIYYIDGAEIGRDTFADDAELADYLEAMSFQDYYSRVLDFAPDNYC